ncbi:hypothetical protein G9A89_014908 [Geosiphon pyriformis]|nr:hypothetical protein G9A89_014908 [Geosiphon pyriformis]
MIYPLVGVIMSDAVTCLLTPVAYDSNSSPSSCRMLSPSKRRQLGSKLDNLWNAAELKISQNRARLGLEKSNRLQIKNDTQYSDDEDIPIVTPTKRRINDVFGKKEVNETTGWTPLQNSREQAAQSTPEQTFGEGSKTPSVRFGERDAFLCTPNKRQMDNEDVIHYLDTMGQSLRYNQALGRQQMPPVWTKSVEIYLDNALMKSESDFKAEIMRKIEGDEENRFRLYCEKVLMDFYNMVETFPNMPRKIGERRYIVHHISPLFKYYEATFGTISFDWIESHSPAAKLTKSSTNSGIVLVDGRGVRWLDDKEIWHMEVAGSLSLSSIQHAVKDTKKSLHTDILNLVAILLDHLDISVEAAMEIRVFSLQVIVFSHFVCLPLGYRMTLYSLNMLENGNFLASELASAIIPFSFDARSNCSDANLLGISQNEIMKQISIMQKLDFIIANYQGTKVRDVLKIPKALGDLLRQECNSRKSD